MSAALFTAAAVGRAREALAELRDHPPCESGRSYAWWVGRLEVVVQSLIDVVEERPS